MAYQQPNCICNVKKFLVRKKEFINDLMEIEHKEK